MANIARRRPFSEIMGLRDDMDRIFGDALKLFDEGYGDRMGWKPLVDLEENENEFIVSAEIPGVKKDDIKISITDNQVILSGEIFENKDEKQTNYHLKERIRGKFSRSFTLPSSIDAAKAEATYKGGILKLRIPKVEEARPKEISIKDEDE